VTLSPPWLDLPLLAQRLALQGFRLGDGNEPLEFQAGLAVHQCLWPLTEGIAMAAAGHLAELGLAPLFLVPPQPWATLRIGAAWPAWQTLLGELNLSSADAAPSSQAAIELFPGRTPLPRVINLLLGKAGGKGAILVADAPMLVTIRGDQGIAWRSTIGALLPKLKL
jgi:hypothetical protein